MCKRHHLGTGHRRDLLAQQERGASAGLERGQELAYIPEVIDDRAEVRAVRSFCDVRDSHNIRRHQDDRSYCFDAKLWCVSEIAIVHKPHSTSPTYTSPRPFASTSCCDLSARYVLDCVHRTTQEQRESRGSVTEHVALLQTQHAFSSFTPAHWGVDFASLSRRGGKRWTGPRPVPHSRPTSRPVGQLGGIRSRLFPIFLSSQQPHQQRNAQCNPGGNQKPFDRSAQLHGVELCA